ncbi:MAG: hypothetical protein ACKVIP_01285 [bacterium]
MNPVKLVKTSKWVTMEMILLFFCLTSVAITSVIVALELRGDKTLSKQSYKGEINTINFHGQQILAKDKNTNEQLRNRVFETLDRQLNQLGYVTKEPQLQFINRTLNSEHTELEELTPIELQTAFTVISQTQESNDIAA